MPTCVRKRLACFQLWTCGPREPRCCLCCSRSWSLLHCLKNNRREREREEWRKWAKKRQPCLRGPSFPELHALNPPSANIPELPKTVCFPPGQQEKAQDTVFINRLEQKARQMVSPRANLQQTINSVAQAGQGIPNPPWAALTHSSHTTQRVSKRKATDRGESSFPQKFILEPLQSAPDSWTWHLWSGVSQWETVQRNAGSGSGLNQHGLITDTTFYDSSASVCIYLGTES